MADQLKLDDLQSYGDLFPSSGNSAVRQEQRQTDRKAFEAEAALSIGGSRLDIRTVDISVGGLCILANKQLGVGTECQVAFDLPATAGTRTILADVQVIYCFYTIEQHFRAGVEFVKLSASDAAEIGGFVGR